MLKNNRTINEIVLYHGATDCFDIVLTLCNTIISLKIMLHNWNPVFHLTHFTAVLWLFQHTFMRQASHFGAADAHKKSPWCC